MKSYKFGDCTVNNLEEWFGIRRNFSSPALNRWLQSDVELSEFERTMLQHLQHNIMENAEVWNEQELIFNIIGPVFSFVNFNQRYRFNFFSQRKIGAQLTGLTDEIELSGEPDGLVATGYWKPETPMFAFTEYKRLLEPNGDPVGQCLAAMLVGQRLNEQPQPLYGCYVVGDAWRFLVLEDKHYTISKTYLATRDDIFDIFGVLKALKEIILELTADRKNIADNLI